MKGIFLYTIKHEAGLFPRHRLSIATRQSRAGVTFLALVGGMGQSILPSFRSIPGFILSEFLMCIHVDLLWDTEHVCTCS